MQKLSMGLLCPILSLFLCNIAIAQNWKQAYALSKTNVFELHGVSAKGNTFLAHAFDQYGTIATVIRSSDGGKTFAARTLYDNGNIMGQPADSVYITTVPAIYSDDVFFAGTKNGIYKSSTKGSIYAPVYRKPGFTILKIDFAGDVGLAIGRNPVGTLTLMRSTNAGTSWAAVTMQQGLVADEFVVVDNQNIYMYHKNFGRFYKSTNAGESWTKLNDLPAPTSNSFESTLNFITSTTGYLMVNDRANNKTYFYKTTNGGTSWRQIHMEQSAKVAYHIKDMKELTVYYEDGSYASMDSSGSVNSTLGKADKYLSNFSVSKYTRYAIAEDTTGRFYVYTTAYTAPVSVRKTEQLNDGELNVYPNPIQNGRLKISYSLHGAANSGLTLMDISGKIILTETIENQPAGNYTKTLNVDQLPKGLYIIELKNASGCQRKKLIIQ